MSGTPRSQPLPRARRIYAYRAEALQAFSQLPPSPLERLEQLEQLRLLQAGIPIRVLEVPPMGAGVDTPEDLERVRAAIRGRRRLAALEKLKRVRLVITDVDGVLTDGGLYYGPDGECLKRFHARDGLGVKLLQKAGIRVAVLSGRDCPSCAGASLIWVLPRLCWENLINAPLFPHLWNNAEFSRKR